jgi:hypothetical protein
MPWFNAWHMGVGQGHNMQACLVLGKNHRSNNYGQSIPEDAPERQRLTCMDTRAKAQSATWDQQARDGTGVSCDDARAQHVKAALLRPK